MTRRDFVRSLVTAFALTGPGLALARAGRAGGSPMSAPDAPAPDRLELPKSVWKKLLPPDAYAVLFEHATERAGSSPLDDEKRPGTFLCAACFLPLFRSEAKFDSGTGWPSFYEPLPDRLGTRRDFKLILPRTEYHCVRCGGHQGHVFDDGPPPTGLRYCNNGVALRFVPDGEPLPALRTGA
ncbi:peptide-methionine (R)-S-oxide reductase MsrB [Myxococcota bacterium]|nr:peptide-methionine (R)-S-oxide reductase MsrB [Myxococcota bacterium]